jgi:hypothetical protein
MQENPSKCPVENVSNGKASKKQKRKEIDFTSQETVESFVKMQRTIENDDCSVFIYDDPLPKKRVEIPLVRSRPKIPWITMKKTFPIRVELSGFEGPQEWFDRRLLPIFNEYFAYISSIRAFIHEGPDVKGFKPIKSSKLREGFRNINITFNYPSVGTKIIKPEVKNMGNLWIKSRGRREYDRAEFAPGNTDPNIYNLFNLDST